jgi:hypothetical protein
VYRDQLIQPRPEGVGVTLAGELGRDVPLRVDEGQGGPGADTVRLPSRQIRVVEDRVVYLVPFDGRTDRVMVGLVDELGRVHSDDGEDVGVLSFERAKLVQYVETVDAAERPEIQ